ncbi:dihydrolipoyl dehydrogenase [Geomicrobium sp. JSM 1781026]|uniref:dihydrolipoyl dehydrogenase n=1 Tax=Geomicrobium sp. JSM 1781026 TaxID=3344580 RepID=UPI0035C1E036
MTVEYDLVVLGAGTGGYVAAIRAAQLGKKVAIVEAGTVGGTCLNRGCIPSKALLKSAGVYRQMKEAATFGVEASGITLNFPEVQKRKNGIVDQLQKGVLHLLKKNNIDLYEGYGRMLGPSIFSPSAGSISVELSGDQENAILVPKNLILATGSKPRHLPGLNADSPLIMTSDEALELEALPASVVIVGGGVIGTEWASMLVDFGVDVTIIEAAPRILMTEDEDVAQEMTKRLKARGVNIVTGTSIDVSTYAEKDSKMGVQADDGSDYEAESLLVSVGRESNIQDIGLQNTDIVSEQGKIKVNAFGQTAEDHIYAIGDIVLGPELAHAASNEGVTAVEHMFNLDPAPLNSFYVPRCIYSAPEAAAIGFTETEAKDKGYEIVTEKVPFKAIGKALINGDAEGFCKVIVDQNNNDLLGVHIIGSHATELISEAALALFVDAAGVEIAETIHPHPTSSEVMKEAALAIDSRAIHF